MLASCAQRSAPDKKRNKVKVAIKFLKIVQEHCLNLRFVTDAASDSSCDPCSVTGSHTADGFSATLGFVSRNTSVNETADSSEAGAEVA